MTGLKLVAKDDNGNPVVPLNGLVLSADQQAVTFANQQPSPDAPAGSTFTVDLIGASPSNGLVNIVAAGQQANGGQFNSSATITVTLDPSIPGPPTHWDFTPGSIGRQ